MLLGDNDGIRHQQTFDTWEHYVLVKGGTGANGYVKLYVNGVLKDTESGYNPHAEIQIGSYSYLGSNMESGQWAVARTTSNQAYLHNGSLRNVAFWDGPLSATEVSAVYNSGLIDNLRQDSMLTSGMNVWTAGTDGGTAYDLPAENPYL